MTTVPLLRDHLVGLLALLEARAAGRFTIGDGQAPSPAVPPYAVVYLVGGGQADGPCGDPEADLDIPVQVTCVGRTQGEALLVRDQVTTILRIWRPTIPGRYVRPLRSAGGPGGARRDDTTTPVLFYCTPLFTLTTTPP